MSMNWNQFLGGFQQGTAIGNQLGSQYALRQLQGEEVQEIPGQPAPATGTGLAINSGIPDTPQAGVVEQPAMQTNTDTPVQGIPQASGAVTYPVSPDGPATDNFGAAAALQQQQPPQQALPDAQQVAQQPPEQAPKMRYSFLGTEYDDKPTELQIKQARAHARANIYEEFSQPTMAAQARNFGDQLGIKGMQKKILDFETKKLQREEDMEMKAMTFQQGAADAYAMKKDAFGAMVDQFGGADTGDGRIMVDRGKDGGFTITKYGVDGKVAGQPQTYKNEADIPNPLRNKLISGMSAEQYGQLGGKYAEDYFQRQVQTEGIRAGHQQAILNKEKFDQAVTQFDKTFEQDEGRIAQAQKNWSAEMGMDIFRFNETKSMNDLKRKQIMQDMNKRALDIQKMKNPPMQFWQARLKILREPWNSSAPEIAMAMGLDILDDQTLPLINDWKESTYQDRINEQLAGGDGPQPGPLQ